MQQIENLEFVTWCCWLVIHFVFASHRDDLQGSLLLLNGEGSIVGDGDCRHSVGHHQDGIGRRVFEDEERGTDGL